jgi:hypothetical protein
MAGGAKPGSTSHTWFGWCAQLGVDPLIPFLDVTEEQFARAAFNATVSPAVLADVITLLSRSPDDSSWLIP